MKGAVLIMLADTLAAHAIGGFKVGVGFALRKCRDCMATKETLSNMVRCSYYVDRNEHVHLFPTLYCSLEQKILCQEHQRAMTTTVLF